MSLGRDIYFVNWWGNFCARKIVSVSLYTISPNFNASFNISGEISPGFVTAPALIMSMFSMEKTIFLTIFRGKMSRVVLCLFLVSLCIAPCNCAYFVLPNFNAPQAPYTVVPGQKPSFLDLTTPSTQPRVT